MTNYVWYYHLDSTVETKSYHLKHEQTLKVNPVKSIKIRIVIKDSLLNLEVRQLY